jgi:hypothetical protein
MGDGVVGGSIEGSEASLTSIHGVLNGLLVSIQIGYLPLCFPLSQVLPIVLENPLITPSSPEAIYLPHPFELQLFVLQLAGREFNHPLEVPLALVPRVHNRDVNESNLKHLRLLETRFMKFREVFTRKTFIVANSNVAVSSEAQSYPARCVPEKLQIVGQHMHGDTPS